jgi:predicted phosphate transport protein (TIGR00153 family)
VALRFRLIPRNEDFFAQFTALADELRQGSQLLEQMLVHEPVLWDKVDEIKEVEHKCDHLTHQIIQRLNSTFVTPIDREDIHALAKSLDDVMDAIDASARFVRLYKITTPRFGARELARVISLSVDEVRLAVEALERKSGVAARAVEINRLENEADRLHEEALKRLFDEERDPVLIIKWKEILDVLEEATDRCEDVANLLEGVVVKNA